MLSAKLLSVFSYAHWLSIHIVFQNISEIEYLVPCQIMTRFFFDVAGNDQITNRV